MSRQSRPRPTGSSSKLEIFKTIAHVLVVLRRVAKRPRPPIEPRRVGGRLWVTRPFFTSAHSWKFFQMRRRRTKPSTCSSASAAWAPSWWPWGTASMCKARPPPRWRAPPCPWPPSRGPSRSSRRGAPPAPPPLWWPSSRAALSRPPRGPTWTTSSTCRGPSPKTRWWSASRRVSPLPTSTWVLVIEQRWPWAAPVAPPGAGPVYAWPWTCQQNNDGFLLHLHTIALAGRKLRRIGIRRLRASAGTRTPSGIPNARRPRTTRHSVHLDELARKINTAPHKRKFKISKLYRTIFRLQFKYEKQYQHQPNKTQIPIHIPTT